LLRIARLLPGIHFSPQQVLAGDAPVQTLATEDADLDFRHVQPAGVFRGVVELYPAQKLGGGTFAQDIVEAFLEVGVQVVEYQVHPTRLGIRANEQFLDEGDEVGFATMIGDADDSLPRFGLNGDEQVGRAVARVLIVVLGRAARGHGQRRPAVADELQAL
jgi:hypothetical protein